jgi:hypothetical protein
VSDPSPKPVTAKSAVGLLKDWKELITFVAATLGSILTAVIGKTNWYLQLICYGIAAVCCGSIGWIFYRKRKRELAKQKAEELWKKREADRAPQSAFRSLASFEERDVLPGKSRKFEARAIATTVGSDDFKFGVVCGDSGCGKTSMLRSEVTRSLKELGFDVSYVKSPRQVESKDVDAPSLERLTREWRTLVSNYVNATTAILILDQFEEWFIEYQDPELRKQLGRFLKRLSEGDKPIRVLCAIRRDYLIDLHDIAEQLPQPLSTKNLFHTKNFTIEQAIDVINECAEAEGIALDDPFAESVAHDLADLGQVRPPELQIVCTYLASGGGLSTSRYRQAGGTAGILAHYIQDALEATRDRGLAARVLRTFCDFPAHAKQKAKTIDELTAEISSSNQAREVNALVHQFVISRILIEEKKHEEAAYALIHDYLVDAVQLATSNSSTKAEEANQLLRFYVGEKSSIPIRKLLFITQFADVKNLNGPAAARVIRRSKIIHLAKVGLPAIVVLLSASYVILTTPLTWSTPGFMGAHLRPGQHKTALVERIKGGQLISIKSDDRFSVWNAATAQQLAAVDLSGVDPNSLWISPTNRFILFKTLSNEPRVFELVSGTQQPLPQCRIALWIPHSEDLMRCYIRNKETHADETFIYDLSARKELCHLDGLRSIAASIKLDRCVTMDEHTIIELQQLSTNKKIADINGGAPMTFDETNSKLFGLINPAGTGIRVAMWDVTDGRLIGKTEATALGGDSPQQKWQILISSPSKLFAEDPYWIVIVDPTPKADGGLNARQVPNLEMKQTDLDNLRYSPTEDGSGTEVFDVDKGKTTVVNGMQVYYPAQLVVDEKQNYAVVWTKEFVDFWDLTQRKSKRLEDSGLIVSAMFTIGEEGILVREEGDTFSLFDALDGRVILNHQPTAGLQDIYYNRECQRIIVWDQFGIATRSVRGRNYFGFVWPEKRCNH